MESEGQTNFSALARCFLPVLTISAWDVCACLIASGESGHFPLLPLHCRHRVELSNCNGEGKRHRRLFVGTLLVWEQLVNCLGSWVCKREGMGRYIDKETEQNQGVHRLQAEGDAQDFLFVLGPCSGGYWRFQIGTWTHQTVG